MEEEFFGKCTSFCIATRTTMGTTENPFKKFYST
jgi:hypothetical protein